MDECGSMSYDLRTTEMSVCHRPKGHTESDDPMIKAHGGPNALRWFDLDDIPIGICAERRQGRTTETMWAHHDWSTNFTRCRTCGEPRPPGTMGAFIPGHH